MNNARRTLLQSLLALIPASLLWHRPIAAGTLGGKATPLQLTRWPLSKVTAISVSFPDDPSQLFSLKTHCDPRTELVDFAFSHKGKTVELSAAELVEKLGLTS